MLDPRTEHSDRPFHVLRLKRALEALGLDVSDRSPAAIVELYERLHPLDHDDVEDASV
jgi:hypothetical protein